MTTLSELELVAGLLLFALAALAIGAAASQVGLWLAGANSGKGPTILHLGELKISDPELSALILRVTADCTSPEASALALRLKAKELRQPGGLERLVARLGPSLAARMADRRHGMRTTLAYFGRYQRIERAQLQVGN